MQQHCAQACACEHRYELCNQYGIYLMDEANVETHGFEPSFTKKNAHPACWPEWHDAIVDRGVRMVRPNSCYLKCDTVLPRHLVAGPGQLWCIVALGGQL